MGLEQSETILGYAIQSPNENGVFDVAFLDENGSVMRLENGSRYSVFISRYDSYRGEWSVAENWAYYEVSYSEEAEASLQSFSDVTDKLPYAHYKMSLLYNGEIVGEQQYYDVLTEMTDVSYSRTSLKNMRGIERFYVYQAEPVTEVKLLLFEQRVASGADAAYQGAAPTRPREGNMLYTFTGWDKSLTGITADLHSCDTFRDFSGSEPPWAYRWDFDNTWVIDKKQNGGFPTLQFKNTRLDLTVTDTLHRPDVNLLEIELDLSK